MVPLFVAISVPIELIFLAFHISVAYFITVRIIKKDTALSSAFFVIYLLQTMADVGSYLTMLYMQRIAAFGLVPGDYRPSSFAGALSFFFSGYFCFYQFIAHCAIAFNRYTVMLHPTAHSKIWDGPRFKFIVFALFVLPGACALTRLWYDVQNVENEFGGFAMHNTIRNLSFASGIISACVSLITCSLSCILEYRTFYAFLNMASKHKREHKEDYRLLLYAMMGFLAHLLMAVEYIFYYIVGSIPPAMLSFYPYIIDILCLCSPVCLLFTSKSIRRKYFMFYGLRRDKLIDVSNVSTTRVHQRPTVSTHKHTPTCPTATT